MSETAGLPIYELGLCGCAANGDVVVFGFKGKDGADYRFHCHAALIPEIMKGLTAAASIAEAERNKISGNNDLVMSKLPFVVDAPSVSTITEGTGGPLPEAIVGLSLPVELGYPLQCAMTRDTALMLARGLQEAATQPAPPGPRRQ
jgi:hypothetical protein